MTDTVEPLILDLLEWVSRQERTYEQVIEVWRTCCPRLPVWEDANDRGLITSVAANGRALVHVTDAGRRFLNERRPATR